MGSSLWASLWSFSSHTHFGRRLPRRGRDERGSRGRATDPRSSKPEERSTPPFFHLIDRKNEETSPFFFFSFRPSPSQRSLGLQRVDLQTDLPARRYVLPYFAFECAHVAAPCRALRSVSKCIRTISLLTLSLLTLLHSNFPGKFPMDMGIPPRPNSDYARVKPPEIHNVSREIGRTGVCENDTPSVSSFALQSFSRNRCLAPDLVL